MSQNKSKKQIQREINRLKNQMDQLESQERKASRPGPSAPSGLSKGQRQRRNRAAAKAGTSSRPLPSSSGPRPNSSSGSGYPNMGKKTFSLYNCEKIRDVKSSDDFRVASLSINPAQAGTFPWLAAQAKNWEKYRFKNLCFFYKHLVSDYAEAGQKGQVILSVDYDASDAPPSNSVEQLASRPALDNLPSKDIYLDIPVRDLGGVKFCRPGFLPGSSDIKTYDAGQVHISTNGIGVIDAKIGELHVAYDVEFITPVLESTNVAPPNKTVTVTRGYTNTSLEITNLNSCNDFVKPNPFGLPEEAGPLNLPVGNYIIDILVTATAVSGTLLQSILVKPTNPGPTGSSDAGLESAFTSGTAGTNPGCNVLQVSGTYFWISDGDPAKAFQLTAQLAGNPSINATVYVDLVIQSV